MQISVLNNYFKKIAFINNNIEKMLHYTNDAWHDNLDNWTTTFDFTIPKWYDGELHDDSLLIDDSCFFSC
ncbi:tail assembly protein [Streptococcus phage Javan389]|nr:tail assembly protein [Streptococcus phage Javan389]